MASESSPRLSLSLNREWKFALGDVAGAEAPSFADSAWSTLRLPDSFSIPYFLSSEFYTGYGWYRRHLAAPQEWKQKRVFLEFDGVFQVAEVFLIPAAARRPRHRRRRRLRAGRGERRGGRFRRRAPLVRTRGTPRPDRPVVPFNLGNVLDELGRTREAEIAYRQAIAREPDMADAWFNLGVLQDAMGREADALASYARAIKSEPAYPDALHNASLLHMRRREFDAALRLLERLLSGADANAAEIRRLAHLCRLEARAAETDE